MAFLFFVFSQTSLSVVAFVMFMCDWTPVDCRLQKQSKGSTRVRSLAPLRNQFIIVHSNLYRLAFTFAFLHVMMLCLLCADIFIVQLFSLCSVFSPFVDK